MFRHGFPSREHLGHEPITPRFTADDAASTPRTGDCNPQGPDVNDLREAVRTLQNLREELPHCPAEYRAQFVQALGVAIVGENSVEMGYYPEVAAVLGAARLPPKTSATRTCASLTLPLIDGARAQDAVLGIEQHHSQLLLLQRRQLDPD